MTNPSPGWYPADGGERYWDGTAWTEQLRPVPPPAPPAPPAVVPGASAKPSVPWYRQTWLVAAIAFLIGIGVGAASTSGSNDDEKSASSNTSKTSEPSDEPTVEDTPTPEPEPEPEPVAFELKPVHFKLIVKIREKTCFGSAGCNVTFQIDPRFAYTVPLDQLADGTWDITYTVTGGEDGPQVNTMRLEDGTFSFDEEESLSTRSSASRITAKVTAVEEVDY